MIITETVQDTRIQINAARGKGQQIAFVPTMGALHEGHLSLVSNARNHVGPDGLVVVSIFVNPTQFAPHEDFDAYPRTMEGDLNKCRDLGVDLIFRPERASMYRPDASIALTESSLSKTLCGASRPHFFGGVCTVVAKLFNIVQPDVAVFGEKDFQQLAIIRRMVRDLDFPIQILGGPIVREADGIAMSSRNANLSPEHRGEAVVLSQSLRMARQALESGERNQPALENLIRTHINTAPTARIDYVELVHPDTLEPLDSIQDAILIAVAVFFGNTRLIDNLCVRGLIG